MYFFKIFDMLIFLNCKCGNHRTRFHDDMEVTITLSWSKIVIIELWHLFNWWFYISKRQPKIVINHCFTIHKSVFYTSQMKTNKQKENYKWYHLKFWCTISKRLIFPKLDFDLTLLLETQKLSLFSLELDFDHTLYHETQESSLYSL